MLGPSPNVWPGRTGFGPVRWAGADALRPPGAGLDLRSRKTGGLDQDKYSKPSSGTRG